jgi:general L-amino acid transport system substrate-binding protein
VDRFFLGDRPIEGERMKKLLIFTLFIVSLFGDKLDDIKKAGFLKCGVNTNLPGFSQRDSKGIWIGLDVDFCKAVSATILGDSSKVKFIPLDTKERFQALKSGKIDILSRNTTYTQTWDTTLGVDFVGVIYYDGQGFMVPKSLGIKSARELDGATICIKSSTTTELNLEDFFKAYKMQYKALKFKTNEEVNLAFEARKCDVISGDASALYAQRTELKEPDKYLILPEVISKEPLSPAIKEGDSRWSDTIRWIRNALIFAEEKDINSTNIDKVKRFTKDSEVKRFLGVDGRMCQNLGLDSECFYRAIKQVGNYKEIFERNIGSKSPLKIKRGLNSIWTEGGLLYSLPFR